MPFARPTSSHHGRMQTKSKAYVRTEGRYRQATGLSHRHPLKEVECIQGHPRFGSFLDPLWGVGTGAGLCDFYRAGERRRRSGAVGALVPRRAGR
jgi:hypothetical protein